MSESKNDAPSTLASLTARASELLDSNPAEAGAQAELGRQLAIELQDRLALAQNLHVLGATAMQRSDYEVAESHLRAGLDIATEIGAKSLVVKNLRTLLKCAFYTHNLEAALLRGLQALETARETGDRIAEALTQNDLGLVYGNQGDYEGALEHLLAGLRILREVDPTKLASLLNNIGNVYVELDEYLEALGFFRAALEAFRGEGKPLGEAIALGNIGRACAGLGKHEDALSNYQESLRIYRERKDRAYEPPALARVATALAALGRTEEAEATLAAADALIESSSRREFEDEIVSARARFYVRLGDSNRAVQFLRRGLQILPPNENSRRVYELHEALAKELESQGDLTGGLRHFKEFSRIRQSVADSAVSVRIRGLMLQFDVERARQQEEIFRLKNVELARANQELQALHEQLRQQNLELTEISMRDSLTGLFNRRYLELQLDPEVKRARRYGRRVCAAMCDVDHFKSINDRYSHDQGDQVLRHIAAILRDSARTPDILTRHGGDEFLLILPETDLVGAATLIARVRERMASHPWEEIGSGLTVTLSVGLAELQTAEDGPDLIRAADARLYEAKRAGRNRTVDGRESGSTVEGPRQPEHATPDPNP